MFFFLSKTLDLLLDPWWWGVGPALAGVVLLAVGRRRAGLALAAVGLGTLTLFSAPAVSNRLWASLEGDARDTSRRDGGYDVVVLLGGVVASFGATAEEAAWGDNVERLTVTFELLRTGRARYVIVSGGTLREGLPTEAAYLARQLEAWGIEPERVIQEPSARNTLENAKSSKALIDARGFRSTLLVTSAFHLPRAVDCFRDVGLEPDTLPVDYRMRDPAFDSHWLPRAAYLEQSAAALRELAGRFVYRLRR
ncbi:MAG: YdcF family protein [Myxococcus sp.]|nr:YdcF family protein [Myxococcus sp.]